MAEEKPLFQIALERILDRFVKLGRSEQDKIVRTIRHALASPKFRRRRGCRPRRHNVRNRAARRISRVLFPELGEL